MLVRRLVAAALVGVPLTLPAVRAYAADLPTDLYVATAANGGDDSHDCSQSNPCATVQQAIDRAADAGATIHVGAGTFSGEIEPGAKSLAIEGASAGDTTLATPQDSGDGYVLLVTSGLTRLSELTVEGGLFVDVFVLDGAVDIDQVVLGRGGCGLVVTAGHADLNDSTIQDGGQGCVTGPGVGDFATGLVVVTGGGVSLARAQLLNPMPNDPAVSVTGGTFSADQTLFDDPANDPETNNSDGIHLMAGTVSVSRSTLHAFGSSGVHNDGGTAFLGDDTFQGNVVGVTGASGSTTVVRGTFQGELAALQSTVSLAGSVLGQDSIRNCGNATVTDLGYNLSTDDSCGFTADTSRGNVDDLNLATGLADRGGPSFLPTVATMSSSPAVDHIPSGATYGGSAQPLCPPTGDTDLRGVPRPAAGACDAGSMELPATTTELSGPDTSEPHQGITLTARVAVPDPGVARVGTADGTVTFLSGDLVLCGAVPLDSGVASCRTSALGAGRRSVTAAFVPAEGAVVHGSTSAPHEVIVGTTPTITAAKRITVHLHERVKITMRASGAPRPVLRKIAGHLPRGLTFHGGTAKATITGTARAAAVGVHHLRVRAVNLVGQDVHRLTLVVRRK